MDLITHTLLRERQRICFMLEQYQAELAALPRGTLSERCVGNKSYFYLKYRSGKKVVSQYIRLADLDRVRGQLERRGHVEVMIQSLLKEKQIADRALEGAL